jgi:alkanesulfonate monooxygenase SsuD/methylene tetrahydromethanopterin reductase-like flavin-dependent oxidoreductase (luciferase family)
MSNSISFGVYAFPQVAPYAVVRAVAQRAEAAGLDAVWVADETPMAYPGSIGFDAWSLLGALARETSRVMLGTLVTPALFRHPLLTAMAASTVDHASDGRVILGFGAGGVPADLGGIGSPETGGRELVERLDEQLDTVDRLLRGETVTRETGFYPTWDAVIERPLQRPRPRIVVAAAGQRALGVAARRADTWNTLGGQPIDGDVVPRDVAVAETRRQIERLEAACAAIGRDPSTLGRSILCFRGGAFASYESMVDWVGRYHELGIREFIFFWPGEPDADAILDRLIAEVLPALRTSGRMP